MRKKAQRRERERLMLAEPDLIHRIAQHMANVGDLGSWCRKQDVTFSNVYGWVMADKQRALTYARAIEARGARLGEKVVARMEALLDADYRKLFDRSGKLKRPGSHPDAVAAGVTEVTTGGRGGDKVKLVPPDRAVELMGRHLGMFREKVELEVTEGVSARLSAARQRAAGRK